MAVERVDEHARRVGRGLDARYVAVGIERYLQLAGLVALDVVAPYAHLGVVLSCLRVLV